MQRTANLVDLHAQTIYYGTITVENGRIAHLERLGDERPGERYVLPGFVDAHVHVESSLLTPAQFARLAVVHGTVGTVSDPHEIANVLGVAGVEFMLNDAARTPFKFCFGAPSCVPATQFETAGATLNVADVTALLARPDIGYLAEMMNFPGVLHGDPDVLAKIAAATAAGKPVDGHAPGLRGEDAKRYVAAGIETDHECTTLDEALDKIAVGMHILIREGSAARNFAALVPLLANYPERVMFCSDDKHPDTLAVGHINDLVRRAIALGCDRWATLRAACLNPVQHYRLPIGLLREGDAADFITVNNLNDIHVLETVIGGNVVAAEGQTRLPDLRSEHPNHFNATLTQPADLTMPAPEPLRSLRVIEALDGQLLTNELHVAPTIQNGNVVADPARDILKLVVVNRYVAAPPAVAFIKNFGLKRGALASSVAHDSHNIIAVGCDDASLSAAINAVIEARGGLAAASSVGREQWPVNSKQSTANSQLTIVPLPVAGLMTDADGYDVARQYADLDRFAKDGLGSTLTAPFMTLSFMALLVIPALKLSDKGLFDGGRFQFVSSNV